MAQSCGRNRNQRAGGAFVHCRPGRPKPGPGSAETHAVTTLVRKVGVIVRAHGARAARTQWSARPGRHIRFRYLVADNANAMIRKISSGKYRLYSRKKNPKTGKRRNLGTFASREGALKHERAVQYFKRH